MRRVLIIGHLDKSIGSFRPLPLASHLREFGYIPIVVTGEVDGSFPFATVNTPCPLPFAWLRSKLSKSVSLTATDAGMGWLFGIYQTIFCYPDAYKGWIKHAIEEGSRIIEREKIDMILSCHPISGHIIASRLNKKYKIPWVADFTDYWSDNPGRKYIKIREWFNRSVEKKTMRNCNAIVTLTYPLADYLNTLHFSPVYVITHGFESIDKSSSKLMDNFTITHTGTIYKGQQNPSLLFRALKELIIEGNIKDVEVRLYGNKMEWVEHLIWQYGLEGIVRQYGMVSNIEAIERQRESQLLWSMNWDDPLNRMFCPYKLFEYLGSDRPIISTGGEGNTEVAGLLRKTHTGIHAPNIDDIKSILKLYYNGYKRDGHVKYNGIKSEVDKYTTVEMTKKFVRVFEEVLL